MKVEVESHDYEGRVYFEFTLQDGPGNRERVKGYATDLIVAFTKIIEWHERIDREYRGGESILTLQQGYAQDEAGYPP